MKLFQNLSILKNCKGSAIAIGNFDGVHKGHQKVFNEAKKFAKKNKIKFGILTFNPLPVMFFNKKVNNFRLTSENQKFKLFKKYNVNFVVNVKYRFMIYQMEKDANHALIVKINRKKLLRYRQKLSHYHQNLQYKYLQKNLRQNQ